MAQLMDKDRRSRILAAKAERAEEAPPEEWRPVPGLERYSASSLGRIRGPRRILVLGRGLHGYLQFSVNSGRGSRTLSVHRMVALAFHGPRPPEKAHVDHIDGVRANNRADNLRYVTSSENEANKARLGRALCGERNHYAILTDAQATSIRLAYRPDDKACGCAALAAAYGVGRATVAALVRGETFKHLPPAPAYRPPAKPPSTKLTAAMAAMARGLRGLKQQRDIATTLGVRPSTIGWVWRGVTWPSVAALSNAEALEMWRSIGGTDQ